MGGFGRYQWIATFFLTLVRNGGNYMYYGFAYLTMQQMYECRYSEADPFTTCSAKAEICPALESDVASIQYQVDTTYEYYMDNWYI